MADFTSGFWTWYISIPTIVGIIAMLFLIRALSGQTTPPQEKVKTMGHVWDEDLAELNNPLPKWWLNLFYITLIFGAIYLLLYPGLGSFKGVLGWSQIGQYKSEMKAAQEKYGPIYDKYQKEPITTLVHDPAAVTIGRRLFATYCTACHGSDAGGGPGFPNLRDSDWLYGGTPKDIETTITNGRQAMMPTWGPILGHKKIFDVAEYVRSLSGHKVDSVVAEEGRKVFEANCAACHGANGKGNQQIGAPNLTDHIWLYGGSQQTIIHTITYGRQGKMPAWGHVLGAAKVHLLATYIYSLSHDKEGASTKE